MKAEVFVRNGGPLAVVVLLDSGSPANWLRLDPGEEESIVIPPGDEATLKMLVPKLRKI